MLPEAMCPSLRMRKHALLSRGFTKLPAMSLLPTWKKVVSCGFRHFFWSNPSTTMSGQHLSLREKQLIFSCVEFFEKEKLYRKKIYGNEPAVRAAEALGVSRRTVFAVKNELSGGPGAAGVREGEGVRHLTGRRKIDFDDFMRGCIRREIHSFFATKEFPTLSTILQACKDHIPDFPAVSRSTLWRLLCEMGFKYKKRSGKRCVHERADNVVKRRNFLRDIRQLREEGRPIVYLDETWVNQHHSRVRAWEDTEEERTMAETPSGKGKRLILLHVGSNEGFLAEECKLLFVGRKDSADYHAEMNSEHFEEW